MEGSTVLMKEHVIWFFSVFSIIGLSNESSQQHTEFTFKYWYMSSNEVLSKIDYWCAEQPKIASQ